MIALRSPLTQFLIHSQFTQILPLIVKFWLIAIQGYTFLSPLRMEGAGRQAKYTSTVLPFFE
jgi:hypothetical protein